MILCAKSKAFCSIPSVLRMLFASFAISMRANRGGRINALFILSAPISCPATRSPPLYPERYFKWVCRGRNERAVLAYLGDVGHIGRWHALYVETIREAARETGSALLDAYTPFLRAWNFPELMCEDGIHPSAGGQRLIAQTALAALGRT